MRDQFAGDLSDYLKFAFLRALASNDRSLGVAWYYNEGNNGKKDGRHLEWREDHAWRALDPELFDALCKLPERTIAALEKMPVWPKKTLFFREPLPLKAARSQWSARMFAALAGSDIVFLDPDNGLGKHPKNHATFAEISELRYSSRALVCIKFPAMENYDYQLLKLHEQLKLETGAHSVFTLRSNVGVKPDPTLPLVVQRPRWFPVIDADSILVERAGCFSVTLATMPRTTARIVNFQSIGQ